MPKCDPKSFMQITFLQIPSPPGEISGLKDVKRKSAAVKSSASSRNAFTGLSLLYTAFACGGVEDRSQASCHQYRAHNRGAQRLVFYVTGAPNKLVGFSLRFLLNSGFPLGPVLPKESTEVSTYTHKVDAITSVIEHLPSATVILVGDNGEHDTEVFAQIQKAFSDRRSEYRIHSFVHLVASPGDPDEELRGAPVGAGQMAFVTAADLGVHFLAQGWIGKTASMRVTEEVAGALADRDARFAVIPAWMNCEGFSPIESPALDTALATSVEARCRSGRFP